MFCVRNRNTLGRFKRALTHLLIGRSYFHQNSLYWSINVSLGDRWFLLLSFFPPSLPFPSFPLFLSLFLTGKWFLSLGRSGKKERVGNKTDLDIFPLVSALESLSDHFLSLVIYFSLVFSPVYIFGCMLFHIKKKNKRIIHIQ